MHVASPGGTWRWRYRRHDRYPQRPLIPIDAVAASDARRQIDTARIWNRVELTRFVPQWSAP